MKNQSLETQRQASIDERGEKLKARFLEAQADIASKPLQFFLDKIEENKAVGHVSVQASWEVTAIRVPELRNLGYYVRTNLSRTDLSRIDGHRWLIFIAWDAQHLSWIPTKSKVKRALVKFVQSWSLPRLKEV